MFSNYPTIFSEKECSQNMKLLCFNVHDQIITKKLVTQLPVLITQGCFQFSFSWILLSFCMYFKVFVPMFDLRFSWMPIKKESNSFHCCLSLDVHCNNVQKLYHLYNQKFSKWRVHRKTYSLSNCFSRLFQKYTILVL